MRSGLTTPSVYDDLRHMLFFMNVYVGNDDEYFDEEHSGAISSTYKTLAIYGAQNKVHRDTVLGTWARCWTHRG